MKPIHLIAISFGLLFNSCSGVRDKKLESQRLPANYTYLDEGLDLDLKESYEEGSAESENKIIMSMVDFGKFVLKRDSPKEKGNVPRHAHAKAHGCVKGVFTVDNKELPTELQLGVFKENKKSFKTWIRFSNNNPNPNQIDGELDLRGMSIKLLGVSGTKILEREFHEETQDFLFFGGPIFFLKDNKHYPELTKAIVNKNPQFWMAKNHPGDGLKLLSYTYKSTRIHNPLDFSYFSATPYRLGRGDDPSKKAVKYNLKRVLCAGETKYPEYIISKKDHSYLREALVQSLQKSSACFDFGIQLQSNDKEMPVEDSTMEWSQSISPYKTVAHLKIPIQEFNTAERNQFCEDLSFNPWHSLPEHRPLGRTNRGRRVVYEQISIYRHSENNHSQFEPDESTIEDDVFTENKLKN